VSAFFVRHWQFTLVLFTGLVLLGANALLTIPRAEDPSVPIPSFVVRTVLPGASPSDMEKLVSKPLEDALDALYKAQARKTWEKEQVRQAAEIASDNEEWLGIETKLVEYNVIVGGKYFSKSG
jgi:multidrug efflux pump subunit AcrB